MEQRNYPLYYVNARERHYQAGPWKQDQGKSEPTGEPAVTSGVWFLCCCTAGMGGYGIEGTGEETKEEEEEEEEEEKEEEEGAGNELDEDEGIHEEEEQDNARNSPIKLLLQ